MGLLERKRLAEKGKLLECTTCHSTRHHVTWRDVYGIILGYDKDNRPMVQNVWRCPSTKKENWLAQEHDTEIRPLSDKERVYLLVIESGSLSRKEG